MLTASLGISNAAYYELRMLRSYANACQILFLRLPTEADISTSETILYVLQVEDRQCCGYVTIISSAI